MSLLFKSFIYKPRIYHSYKLRRTCYSSRDIFGEPEDCVFGALSAHDFIRGLDDEIKTRGLYVWLVCPDTGQQVTDQTNTYPHYVLTAAYASRAAGVPYNVPSSLCESGNPLTPTLLVSLFSLKR